MPDKTEAPVTLGDKLGMDADRKPIKTTGILVIPAIVGLLVGWGVESPELGLAVFFLCVLLFLFVLLAPGKGNKGNFVTYADRQGFMKDLKLSDKTALFDGSNIYHFGIENGVGEKALAALVRQLRADGFRVVCFFDANIYFTMAKNGAFEMKTQRFSTIILQKVFGLKQTEIYIVPSGTQADAFIIESLSLLPISFAVTNDRFRDYEADYRFLAKDSHWRKGVAIKNGNLLLYQYKFKQPLAM